MSNIFVMSKIGVIFAASLTELTAAKGTKIWRILELLTDKIKDMKVTKVRITKSEKNKVPAFISEVNACPDTFVTREEWYYCDELVIVAIGTLAMEYTMRKVECTFDDYSTTILR